VPSVVVLQAQVPSMRMTQVAQMMTSLKAIQEHPKGGAMRGAVQAPGVAGVAEPEHRQLQFLDEHPQADDLCAAAFR
jgi:hypothetical protein